MTIRDAMWIVTAAAVVGTWANAEGKRWCFPVWLATNLTLLAYNLSLGEHAQAGLWAVYCVLAVRGWVSWGRAAGGGPRAGQGR